MTSSDWQYNGRYLVPSQELLKRQHCGMIASPISHCLLEMPDLWPVLGSFPGDIKQERYLFDIKVHMLMPGQWPCIPNWHCDFVPRDSDGKLCPDLVPEQPKTMWLYVSGHPFTQFRDGRTFYAGEWVPFTQKDWHRGSASELHCWRLFIRAAPADLVPDSVKKIAGVRRHCQVYLDSENFVW